jgi:hypothetical protein
VEYRILAVCDSAAHSQNPQQRLLLSLQAKDWSDKAVYFSGLV